MQRAAVGRMRPETLTLDVDGTYRLTRLTDDEFCRLHESSIAIEDVSLWFEYCLWGRLGLSNLAEFYTSMKGLFGERGRCFDDWKFSFSFPLALDIPGASRSPAYVLDVTDWRGSVEHCVRKVVDASDPRLENRIYYPSGYEDFPPERMREFLFYLVGFQEGLWKSLGHQAEPFFLSVPSNLIVYGFDGHEFFDTKCESREAFDAETARLAARLPTPGFYPEERPAR